MLEIIFFEAEQFRSTKLSAKKSHGKILKAILYGSYARGDWMEDRLSGYRSDYDLLVIVNKQSFADEDELWLAIDERLIQEQIAHRIRTPVLPVVHSLHDFNDQLTRGRPFFVDIARDGRLLYEEPGHPLAQPKPLSETEKHSEAQRHFDQWSPDTVALQEGAKFYAGGGHTNLAAFTLHQAAERLYHCLLLTLNRIARRRFKLLSRAYVEARYSASYEITVEELEWLAERVKVLLELVETICRERLDAEKHS